MGGEYFADENGDFELVIHDSNGDAVDRIYLRDFEPEEEIYVEIALGRCR